MRQVLTAITLWITASGAFTQQGCKAVPEPSFEGVVGRTAEDSTPSLLQPARPPAGSPNVVYIVLDDTGFGDLGCYGASVSTPNIDSASLAAGPVSSTTSTPKPSAPPRAPRSSPAATAIRRRHEGALRAATRATPTPEAASPPPPPTSPRSSPAGGYSTYAVGKWHLVPREDMAAGRRTHPLAAAQKGFQRLLRLPPLAGPTSIVPELFVLDNHAATSPANATGYHFSEDIAEQADQRCSRGKQEARPRKALLPLPRLRRHPRPHPSPQALHREIRRSRFDDGWDVSSRTPLPPPARARRHSRREPSSRRAIPATPPGPPSSDKERKVYARFMEAYAGFTEHVG